MLITKPAYGLAWPPLKQRPAPRLSIRAVNEKTEATQNAHYSTSLWHLKRLTASAHRFAFALYRHEGFTHMRSLVNALRCRKAWIALVALLAAYGSGQAATTASYDALAHLKEQYTAGHKTTYTYDNADNRTAQTIVTGGLSSSVDVGVSGAALPAGAVVIYHKITYSVVVSNFSGSAATTLSLTFTPPTSMTLVSTTAGAWSCSGTGTVSCTLTSLASNTDSALAFVYRPTALNSTATASVSVTSAGSDIQASNNSDAISSVIRSSGDTSDVDGDGMADAWESSYGLSSIDPDDAALDADGDGLSNLAEYSQGTSPRFNQKAIAPLLHVLW